MRTSSTNMGEEMVARLAVEESALASTVATELASSSATRELLSRAEAGTIETVRDLANATQRPIKSTTVPVGHAIETNIITTTSGKYLAVETVNTATNVRKLIAAGLILGTVIPKLKPEEEDPTESKCQVCATRLTNSADDQALCTKLTNLASKSRTHGTFAVNKLCANITNTVTLKSVVDRVLTFTQQEAEAFLADINGSTCTDNYLCSITNISQIDVSIVNAWKYIVDAMNTGTKRTAFAQDFPLINKVKEITTNTTKLNAFTNPTYSIKTLSEFLKVYGFADCYSCSIAANSYGEWMSKMDVILENSLDAQTKYLNRGGYAGYAGYATREPFNNGANQWLRDGGQHMYRGMKSVLYLSNNRTLNLSINPNIIVAFDEPFGAANNPNYPNQKCDLRLDRNNTASQGVLFVEFKSYQEDTELTTKGVSQFLGYLSDTRVNSLNDIVYVFNRKKVDDAQAKAKMQTVFQGAKANDIFNIIYSKMAVSLGLSPNATTARQQYNNLVTNLDDKIFGFVITN